MESLPLPYLPPSRNITHKPAVYFHSFLYPYRASFIPAIRKVFRRSSKDKESNDTEYAFKRSKGLISRILDSVHGKGKFASIAFFVLAILYVFQSEVSMRVARTVSKRLKRLMAKIERGDQGLGEDDVKLLKGWRWRVLLW